MGTGGTDGTGGTGGTSGTGGAGGSGTGGGTGDGSAPSETGPMPPPLPQMEQPLPPCKRTVDVANDGALGGAISGAMPGDCLVLADGNYGMPGITKTATAEAPHRHPRRQPGQGGGQHRQHHR